MRMAATADLVRSGLQAGTMRALNYTVCLVSAAEGVPEWRAQVCLLQVREHGFMILTPEFEEIRATLNDWEVDADTDQVVISEVDCAVETNRGTHLGVLNCFICDVPWAYLPLFRKVPVRGLGEGAFTFEMESVSGRPVLAAAREVARIPICCRRTTWTRTCRRRGGTVARCFRWQASSVSSQETTSSCRRRRYRIIACENSPVGELALRSRQSCRGSTKGCSGKVVTAGRRQRRTFISGVGVTSTSSGVASDSSGQARSCEGSAEPSNTWHSSGSRSREGSPGSRGGAVTIGCRDDSGSDSRKPGSYAKDAVVAASPDQPIGQGLSTQVPSRSIDSRPKRRGQRERFVFRRLCERERLRCSRSLFEADCRGPEGNRCGQKQRPNGVGYHCSSRRTISLADLLGTTSAYGRSQDSDPSGVHACSRMGDWSGAEQYRSDGLRSPDDDLHRASMPGWRKNATGLVDDGTERTQFPTAQCEPSSKHSEPLCSVSFPHMDCSKRLVLARHRHLRDQIEADRCVDKARKPSTDPRRKRWKGWQKNQEEGREGGRSTSGSLKHNSSAAIGMPEQRSSGSHSCSFECDRSPDQTVPVWGSPDRLFSMHKDFDPLHSFIEPSAIVCDMLRLLERVPTSFNVFRARSLKPAWISRNVEGTASHVPLWPVPPPLWRWTGNSSPGRKQRKRRRLHHIKFLLLQRMVCMLNWIVLGYPDTPSHRAQAGEPISEEQVKVLDTLADHISHFCNIGQIARADLGRFGEKFGALQTAAEELPEHLEVDLNSILREISDSMSSYVKREKPHFAEQSKHEDDHSQCHHEPCEVAMPNITNKPVIAKRIKWKHPPAFDARPFLVDPVVAAVYDNPDTLRTPSYLWPNRSKARVHCDRPELLELMKVWGAHGSLALFPCHEINPQETVGLFAVPKDENFDRLIINPTVLNSRMMPYSNFTRKLAPGVLLGLLSLNPNESFRFCADDLSDFYYTFKVSRARAKRNCIGTVVYSREVQNLKCFDSNVRGPFYPALATLAMGDSHAVEIAQGSHFSLLQLRAGCMRDSETLQYRKPIPRGDFFELLAIDDHIGVQRVQTSELSLNKPSRDTF